jgi:hypothetical protein
MTLVERLDATSLRVRRYHMMGLPKCPYVSTLAGTKVWPGCRWLAYARYLSLSAERPKRLSFGSRVENYNVGKGDYGLIINQLINKD